MSRSGYTDDCQNDWQWVMWRGRVESSIRGKRGQKLLHELLDALDTMPSKRLISNEFWNGEACALGALAERRGVDPITVDTEDYDRLSDVFDVASPLIQEIECLNDDCGPWQETPEQRWERMRRWVTKQLKESWSVNKKVAQNDQT